MPRYFGGLFVPRAVRPRAESSDEDGESTQRAVPAASAPSSALHRGASRTCAALSETKMVKRGEPGQCQVPRRFRLLGWQLINASWGELTIDHRDEAVELVPC